MKRVGRFLKWAVLVIIILIITIICTLFIVRFIKGRKTKITTENGIQEDLMVEMGGIKQYVQLRGKNKNNPVVVFLHGGPGSPTTFLTYSYQTPLEENYTFAVWDQRGCGRTYYANPGMDMKTQLSTSILLEDLDDLVDYLRDRFAQDKVIIFGHSWGTALGSQYVKLHPEKVMAYLGVGQTVEAFEGYNMAAKEALRLAKETNNTKDINKLSEIIAGVAAVKSQKFLEVNLITGIQKFSGKYMVFEGGASGLRQMWLGLSSPDFSFTDAKWFWKGLTDLAGFMELQHPIMAEAMAFDLNSLGYDYEVPMYYIAGEGDWTTPTSMVEEYYKKVEAPDKELIVIKNAGHAPFVDQPKLFEEAVKKVLSRVK